MEKVCHITSAHPRYDQRILYRECVSLQDAGYEVTLVVNDVAEDEIFRGVNIVSTNKSYKGKRFQRMLLGVKNVYNRSKEIDADIYHIHDPELLRVALKYKKMGKKVIFDSHEDYVAQIREKRYLPKFLRNMIANLYYIYESYVFQRIDGVVSPAKMDSKNLENRALKIAYVDNRPRLDELPAKGSFECEEREGLCYAGGLTYERGILFAAKAASLLKSPLYLAGAFSSEKFEKEILEGENADYVHYEGMLGREEVYRLYSRCAIGLCTLLRVGQYAIMPNLPTKVYEYMAMGMPVILSDIPSIRAIIEKHKFGMLVDPENPEDIAEKVRYLYENPDEMRAMGKKGKELVYTEWNWKSEGEKLLDLYKKI